MIWYPQQISADVLFGMNERPGNTEEEGGKSASGDAPLSLGRYELNHRRGVNRRASTQEISYRTHTALRLQMSTYEHL